MKKRGISKKTIGWIIVIVVILAALAYWWFFVYSPLLNLSPSSGLVCACGYPSCRGFEPGTRGCYDAGTCKGLLLINPNKYRFCVAARAPYYDPDTDSVKIAP